MKKLSIFQISLLAVFGACAVAAVLIFSLAVGGGTQTSVGAVKIWGTLDGTAFAAVIRAAADTNPAIAQVTYTQKDPATFDDNLTKALASGQGPDLVLMRQDYAAKDAGQIAVIPSNLLSQTQFSNTFVASADPFFTQSGALGIPILADPLVLYWNKDMLASAGASQPPAYWDQIFTLAQKMAVKDTAGNILKSAIAFGEYRNVDNAKDIVTTLILQAGGTITSYDTAGHLIPTLSSKTGAGSQASESALRFYTEFADPSKDDYSWSRAMPLASQAFAAGQTGLYVGYASEQPAIARTNPNLNFGVAALPQIRTASATLTSARVYALLATRAGINPSAAITAAAALATTENAQALSTALGIPSARRDVLAAASERQIPGQLVSQNDICKGIDVPVCSAQISRSWVDPDPEATNVIFQAMIEDTTSGAQLLTAAIQRADQQMTQLTAQTQ
jgi:ABC-type glycerol-3-phosphate transport system substrate-binding protein